MSVYGTFLSYLLKQKPKYKIFTNYNARHL